MSFPDPPQVSQEFAWFSRIFQTCPASLSEFVCMVFASFPASLSECSCFKVLKAILGPIIASSPSFEFFQQRVRVLLSSEILQSLLGFRPHTATQTPTCVSDRICLCQTDCLSDLELPRLSGKCSKPDRSHEPECRLFAKSYRRNLFRDSWGNISEQQRVYDSSSETTNQRNAARRAVLVFPLQRFLCDSLASC